MCNSTPVLLLFPVLLSRYILRPVFAAFTPQCADAEFTPERCCKNPPIGDVACWEGGFTFELCCSRFLNPRSPTQGSDATHLRTKFESCLQLPAPMSRSSICGTSGYAATEGHRLGRLIWCAVQIGGIKRVFDVFLGSGCSAVTAAAAMDARQMNSGGEDSSGGIVIGFQDLESDRSRKAMENLKNWRVRMLRAPKEPTHFDGLMRRLRQDSLSAPTKSHVWFLSGPLRPNSTECLSCAETWTLDCPERCAYEFGMVEAACEALSGIDMVFFDSDGSAADDWLFEWLIIERACAPMFVFLLNLSLPNHAGWIRERLLGSGYAEVLNDRILLHPVPYQSLAYSDVRRVRSWTLLVYEGAPRKI